ncbi:MAG: AAA family ATPase [Bacteroidales bacterium]|nr:AAA family ATPase [Bacteroidales bacterium]
MIIIGITGTLGAGKGTIVELLKNEYGYKHYSVRDYLVDEIKKRNLDVNRDSMTSVANELRSNNSPSFITDELYNKAIKNNENCIIESIRTPGEIDSLHNKGSFYLFAVDADSKIRYNRIQIRKSSTDNIDYHTFIANEKREMNTDDPNKQNLAKCISLADFVFNNNGDINKLNVSVREVISKINN